MPLNLIEMEDYVMQKNTHYRFHTSAQIVRELNPTQDERDDYAEYLEKVKTKNMREMKFMDFLL